MITFAASLFIFLASCRRVDAMPNIVTSMSQEDAYVLYEEIPKLDDTEVFGPDAIRDFYMVLIIGLFALQLNLFGSLYIIYRTYLQWNRGGRNSIPLSLRFPFYIALTDALLSLAYTIDLSYTLVWKHTWSNPACRIIGTSVITLFIMNMFLVGIIALTTWSYVCREYYVEFGSYDYKLWAVTLLLSAVVFAVSINNTGQQRYWCAARHHTTIIPIIMIVFIFSILITILVCYVKILLKIRSNDDTLFMTRCRRARVEKRALRKLISYIFTFILQFIPLLAYNFFSLAMIESVFLYILAITTINFGGIGNFIQFVINEGLRHSVKSSSQSSSVVKEVKEQNPQTNSIVPKETKSVTAPAISDDIDIDIISDIIVVEPIPDIISSSNTENGGSIIYTKKIDNVDNKCDNDNELCNDDGVYYDALTVFDSTVLVTANSSDVLLNQEDDFLQELDQYNEV